MSNQKKISLPTIKEDDEKSEGGKSNQSGKSGRSDASSMLLDSFEQLDDYISKASLKNVVPELAEIENNPTKDRLVSFRRRFEALFLILDAQMRMSKFPFVVIGPDGTIVLASPSMAELFGYSEAELIGNNINLLQHEELAVRHDAILANYCHKVSTGTTDGHSAVVNATRPVTARHKNGKDLSIEITVKSITSGEEALASADGNTIVRKDVVLFVGQMRDVRQEVALRNTIEEFSTLQSIFPFPYLEATEHMIISKFNPAAAQAFGLSAERAIGKNVTILMPKYIYQPTSGKKINKNNHDKIVSNYVSKIRSVGKASVTSRIVDQKTSHEAMRINTSDPTSIVGETFPMELEVKMQLSSDGSIKFQAFARDCSSYMNAAEARNNVIMQTFPEPIARDLINGIDVNGERDMSVLFCDIVGFTQYSSMLADNSALQVLSDLFTRFTEIKKQIPTFDPIKTNYDEFMAVTGLDQSSHSRRNHTDDAIRCAFGMLDILRLYNSQTSSQIDIRIGIDSGPCMCGILGSAGQKSFDIIGQTSVRASRAENTAKPGTVHITEGCYERISVNSGLRIKFKPNGTVTFKNMGAVKTYISAGRD